MNKNRWILLALLALAVSGILPAALTTGVDGPLCVPWDANNWKGVTPKSINVLGGQLQAKFIYPKPTETTYYSNLPGLIIAPGYAIPAAQLEAQAESWARQCYVTLLFSWRGQGASGESNTQFTFYSDIERDDLAAVKNALLLGPPGTTGMVDADHIGILGVSQGGLASWLAVADVEPTRDLRGSLRVAMPRDASPFLAETTLLQDCFNANVAAQFDPDVAVTWEPTLYAQLAGAFLTPQIPITATWQSILATRDPGDELAFIPTAVGTPGTPVPFPQVFVMGSQYDVWQWTDEMIAGWQTVTPPAPITGYPGSRLLLSRGETHTNDPWLGDKEYREAAERNWLSTYLGPFYVDTPTATSVPNPTGTPPPTLGAHPTPVEYRVDSFSSTPGAGATPTFTWQGANSWPPPSTPITLYLRSGPDLELTPPATTEGYDVLNQDYTANGYNLETAIAERVYDPPTPYFNTLDQHLNDHSYWTLIYVSPRLNQDVTLVGPPTIHLYGEPDTGAGYPLQVHLRVFEKLYNDSTSFFVTHANACAWEQEANGWFEGNEFRGDTRVHTFKEGNHIAVEIATIDEEYYYPQRTAVSVVPYLGDMVVRVFHRTGEATSITLPLVFSDAQAALFQAEGGDAPGAPEGEPEPTATPTASGPLTIEAVLWNDDTNPGGWRAWAPEVKITCTGGVGAVTCPGDTFLLTDGLNQSFTFTATDEVGNVDTVTLSGISIDRTPPQVTTNLPASQTFCSTATLQLDLTASDALSGLDGSAVATFNGAETADGQFLTLLAGPNVLAVQAQDVAGNHLYEESTLQVNYDVELDFPPDGQTVNPAAPLSFAFRINDACAASGVYGGATATLWLTGPNGQEQAAVWSGGASGNAFAYNTTTSEYTFDADVSGLAAGTWTARVHLSDVNDYTVTFVVP
ncbi:MAG: CocE/NonD family hydrolase C-terminal non-catalytic domain-containing protein [Chloroflexota bacterium]